MLYKFLKLNIFLSKYFEKIFPFNSNDKILLFRLLSKLKFQQSIADVGGGKKPAKNIVEVKINPKIIYDGYDISIDELIVARHHYDGVFELDLTKKQFEMPRQYDIVICLNTLEHVNDVSMSIAALSKMLKNEGKLYLKLPSKHAIFAKLNLLLPNEFKKTLMHKIFPHKVGDGFKVYYDKSTPKQIIAICEENGLQLVEMNLVKWSSYFSFLFPLYIIWRCVSICQNIFISDYCESFEVVFIKSEQ
jgi:SAM-dependent methyltransferase